MNSRTKSNPNGSRASDHSPEKPRKGTSVSAHQDISSKKKEKNSKNSGAEGHDKKNESKIKKKQNEKIIERLPEPLSVLPLENFQKLVDYNEFEELECFQKKIKEESSPQLRVKDGNKEKDSFLVILDQLKTESKRVNQLVFTGLKEINIKLPDLNGYSKMDLEEEKDNKTQKENHVSNSNHHKNIAEQLKSAPNTSEDISTKIKELPLKKNFASKKKNDAYEQISQLVEKSLIKIKSIDSSKDGKQAELSKTKSNPPPEIPDENLKKIKEAADSITESDLQRLDPEVYLNDSIINFWLKVIELGFISEQRRKQIHIFNTYFMAKMRTLFAQVDNDYFQFDSVYEKLERWVRKVDIFQKDFLLIPLNENEHWDLIILCYPNRLLTKDDEFPFVIYLDSICPMEDAYAKMLFHFVAREVKSKKREHFEDVGRKISRLGYNTFPHYQQMIPKQQNWTDCGLYLLQYAELFAEDESYILENKEDLDKIKWFPRKVITDKREEIRNVILDVKKGKFESVKGYVAGRQAIIKEYENKRNQYDKFDEKEFERAVYEKYDEEDLTPDFLDMLKLRYYYWGTLEFDQPELNF